MAKVTYDGQSFSVDGQRVWLVSGAIHYARVPRELWRSRIRAAKQAGLNCIETYVFWNFHEEAEGEYDWTGDRDLRHFVELIGEEGMWCWLRPGPYVCAEWDNGGLPAWLHTVKTDRKSGPMKLREGSGPYLGAVSRYLGEVMRQVGDLQVTGVGRGKGESEKRRGESGGGVAGGFNGQGAGPILLMQAENEWFCHNPQQEEEYLGQVVRYLAENGCRVPINVCNQLWQEVEGTFDTWNASANLPADMRQLRVVQPDWPRIVSEYWTGWFDAWGGKHADTVDADKHLYRMAGVLAAGAQYNLFMFLGGTNFGFYGGRTVGSPTQFMTTSYDYDAPLSESGGRGAKYAVTKRISTFASHFGAVFAHLDPERQPAAVHPDETPGAGHALSVVHLRGNASGSGSGSGGGGRGDVVLLLRTGSGKAAGAPVLLPNGLSLPVEMGNEAAAWFVLDAPLGGGHVLDYTNLRPWAAVGGRMLVLFGPAGTRGLWSLDDAPGEVDVPTGKTPTVLNIDGVTVVVLNVEQVDASYLYKGGLVVGSNGLDAEGEPEPLRGWPTQFRIDPDGEMTKVKASVTRKPVAPKLGPWRTAGVGAYVDGSAPAYRQIKGPTSLDRLGANLGYGWYRIEVPGGGGGGKAKREAVILPGAADRLHVFRDGKPEAFVGDGPGGNAMAPEPMRLAGTVTVLADNLGRYNYGARVGEEKGVWSDFYAAKPVKLGKPEVAEATGPDMFQLAGYVPMQRAGERRPAQTLTWTVKPAVPQPMVLDIVGLPVAALLRVNGEAVATWLTYNSGDRLRLTLDPTLDGPFTAGSNTLELALTEPLPDGVRPLDHLTLYQCTANLTGKASWSFAPWERPGDEAFGDGKPGAGQPAWYRTTFNGRDGRCPLFLHPKGLSKGQIYLNGHNVGRYFMRTPAGKAVGPQELYYLPEPWIHETKQNELTLFDEHGLDPKRCELVYEEMGPYGG